MRHVYMSFLGLGSFNKQTEKYEYQPAVYSLNGKTSSKVPFVQAAEIEILGSEAFDKVIIVSTQISYNTHFKPLSDLLNQFKIEPVSIIIEDDISPKGQWEMFEKILAEIDIKDALTLDLTHGYRFAPIIISAAVNFLQKAREIILDAVYYGAFEKLKENQGIAPIVDMKDFYLINEWAESVSRLVEDADARKLADTAKKTPSFQIAELNDQILISAFEDLTNTIRNVDVNNVYQQADKALKKLIQAKMNTSSITGSILLNMVYDKFTNLTIHGHQSKHYDRNYFNIQIEIIKILLEHKLYMQAYTVMREFIASVGMVEARNPKISNAGRKDRRRFGEVFVRMVQFPKPKWNFQSQNQDQDQGELDKNELLPYYEKLESIGVIAELESFAKTLIDYRNGFDHAWTAKAKAENDIPEKGDKFLQHLETVVQLLENKEVIT